jgi:hypothetical protein
VNVSKWVRLCVSLSEAKIETADTGKVIVDNNNLQIVDQMG